MDVVDVTVVMSFFKVGGGATSLVGIDFGFKGTLRGGAALKGRAAGRFLKVFVFCSILVEGEEDGGVQASSEDLTARPAADQSHGDNQDPGSSWVFTLLETNNKPDGFCLRVVVVNPLESGSLSVCTVF